MPEYLAPGVYVEEVSFRSKSIEGVPTSTTGFTGLAHYGPVYYLGGPKSSEPRLITSFTEFERVYGGLEPLKIGLGLADVKERPCYLAHAVRAFFENGGKRVYISRVFKGRSAADTGVASVTVDASATWTARWPGEYGNVVVETKLVRSKNLAFEDVQAATWRATRVRPGAVVEIYPAGTLSQNLKKNNDPLDLVTLAVVDVDNNGEQVFIRNGQTKVTASKLTPNEIVQLVEMQVIVRTASGRVDVYDELATDLRQKRYITRILDKDNPEDENALVYLLVTVGASDRFPAELMNTLRGANQSGNPLRLDKGNDGMVPAPVGNVGDPSFGGWEADLDDPKVKAFGLAALGEIEDIAIVAMPDAAALDDPGEVFTATQSLISHAENMRYRIAVVDAPVGSSLNEIRKFRGQFDSKYSALYHPWIEILDPTERPSQGAPPKRLLLPPSGFVTGIYARSDIERGVHKAPANEIVRGLTRFEANINKARQDVLNPEGINALRFFEGRGNRVWGARTMSSDPEWKYVNVRRLFIYIEHSIDKGTQWAVFEPNGPRLWANIRQTIEDFLLVLWRDGALLGDKPEQAYFVRCDRTTMTQNDLDNGRLICLVGLAPVKPAEFVIFRIGQWTADAKI